MKTYPIHQLLNFPTGTHIEAFTGEILHVGKYFFGTTNDRDWSLQDLKVRDPNGDEIVVTLDKKDELDKSWQGRPVLFTAYHGDRGMSGIIVEDHTDRRNKTFRRLRITKTGDIAEGNDNHRNGPGQSQTRQSPQQRPQNAPQGRQNAPQGTQQGRQGQGGQSQPQNRQQTAGNGQGQAQAKQGMSPAEAVKRVKTKVAKLNTLRSICYDAAVARAHQTKKLHGHTTAEGGIGAESTTLFIECIKSLPHNVIDALPLDLYKLCPFQSVPLSELTPDKENLGSLTPEEFAAANVAAKAAISAMRTGEPLPQAPAENEPEWRNDGNGDPSWKQEMEKDDIQF